LFYLGDTFLIKTNHDRAGYIQHHLFVIVAEIDKKTHQIVIIPIDTIRGRKFDHQTVLQPGCHDFVTSASYVNYRRTRVISIEELDDLVTKEIAKKRDSLLPEVLEQIRDGILKSDFTPMEVRELYEAYLFTLM
jgi:hypothetical protein